MKQMVLILTLASISGAGYCQDPEQKELRAPAAEEIVRQEQNMPIQGRKAETKSQPAQPKKLWAKSFLNQKAPELVVEKWLGAKPEVNGKFILIDFWATWCPPCRITIGVLNKIHEKFADRLVIIGLSDESEKTVRGFSNPHPEYFEAIDTRGRMKNEVKVEGIPHIIIMDPKGIVRWEGYPLQQGYELTDEVVEEVLNKYSQ